MSKAANGRENGDEPSRSGPRQGRIGSTSVQICGLGTNRDSPLFLWDSGEKQDSARDVHRPSRTQKITGGSRDDEPHERRRYDPRVGDGRTPMSPRTDLGRCKITSTRAAHPRPGLVEVEGAGLVEVEGAGLASGCPWRADRGVAWGITRGARR